MSASVPTSPHPVAPVAPEAATGVATEVGAGGGLPLLLLWISSAAWAVFGSGLGLVASLKFHAPDLLAGSAWLGYGRLHPAAVDAMLYGFCVQAGLGFALWLMARMARAGLAQSWLVTLGAGIWNVGITVGVLGILAGDSTGFETLEMPGYAALLAFIGYLLIGLAAVVTFHQRRQRALYVSQWFLLTALFWFPWIYSSANLLLVSVPVRGVAQSVIAWWYAENIRVVWFGLVGLAAAFYFIPKFLNRELHSHYLALVTYWMLILVASWGGIPRSAPVPAWLPSLSTAATVLAFPLFLAVALNVYRTTGRIQLTARGNPALSFILFSVPAFLLAELMRVAGAVEPSGMLHFSWYAPAQWQLQFYGFFALAMFGAAYALLPRVMGLELPFPRLVRAHFWLAAAGVLLTVLPLAIGGIVQTLKMLNPAVAFTDVTKATLPFLRASTLGDLLLLVGHLLFLVNLVGLAVGFYRQRALRAYGVVTADLFQPAEAKA